MIAYLCRRCKHRSNARWYQVMLTLSRQESKGQPASPDETHDNSAMRFTLPETTERTPPASELAYLVFICLDGVLGDSEGPVLPPVFGVLAFDFGKNYGEYS